MSMLRLLVRGPRDQFRSRPSLEAELATLCHRVALLRQRLDGYCERVIGMLRYECLHQVISVNEREIQRVLDDYRRYDNRSRTHVIRTNGW